MKFLRAFGARGNHGDDFRWTEDDELVFLPCCPCDNKSCGCDRSFNGVKTAKGSTLAMVDESNEYSAEHEIPGLVEMVRKHAGQHKFLEARYEKGLRDALEVAANHPIGTVLRVKYDRKDDEAKVTVVPP
jgi:hypothetical protein